MFRPQILGLLAAFLLAGCVTGATSGAGGPSAGAARQAAASSAFMDPGPFAPNEVSIYQAYFPAVEGVLVTQPFKASEQLFSEAASYDAGLIAKGWPRQGSFDSQLTVRRVGDAFAFRMFLRGLKEVPRGLVRVKAFGRHGSNDQPIGVVDLGRARVYDSPAGRVVDTGWVWSPEGPNFTKIKKIYPLSYKVIDDGWKEYRQAMPASGPLIGEAWAKHTFSLEAYRTPSYMPGKEKAVASNLYGEEALRLLDQSGTYYAEANRGFVADEARRDEIIAWMRQNVLPVSPIGFLEKHCGVMPAVSAATSLPATGRNSERARVRNETQQADRYAACLRRVRGQYDPSAYAAIYPQAFKLHQEYVSKKFDRGYADYIGQLDDWAPNKLPTKFDSVLAAMENPQSDARRLSEHYDARDAQRARQQAEEAREEREAERRSRARAAALLRATAAGAGTAGAGGSAVGGGASGGGGYGAGSGGGGAITLSESPKRGGAPEYREPTNVVTPEEAAEAARRFNREYHCLVHGGAGCPPVQGTRASPGGSIAK